MIFIVSLFPAVPSSIAAKQRREANDNIPVRMKDMKNINLLNEYFLNINKSILVVKGLL